VIELADVSVRQGTFRLDGVSLVVPPGGHGVLKGRTGSGKTSLLEIVAGLRRPAGGAVRLGGRDVTRCRPADRGVGYVPQDAAVFRHLTVAGNLGFALAVRRAGVDAVRRRVEELADWLGLVPLLDRRATDLSGGERQRVALGRALAAGPPVLLLDEPTAALDDATRQQLHALLIDVRRRTRATILHVTHSETEAQALATVTHRLAG
jgi:ABC-type sugar transport system ATPase subunit